MGSILGTATRLAACLGLLGAPVEAQTLDEVQWAVEHVFGWDEQNDRARDQLTEWGNDALVQLAVLADQPGAVANFHLLVAIEHIDTRAGYGLLLELLELESPYPLDLAFSQLARSLTGSASHTARSVLGDSTRFREAVVARLEGRVGPGGYSRSQAVEVVAELGWREYEPLLRELLEHPNHDLRRDAAEALRELTGERVVLAEDEPSFPAERLHEELFTHVPLAPGRGVGWRTGLAFIDWARADLPPARGLLVAPRQRRALLVGPTAQDVQELFADSLMEPVLVPHPDTTGQLLVGIGGPWNAPCVEAVDGFGDLLWSFEDRGDPESLAVLVDGGEVRGVAVAFGGETGVVALDPRGEVLWRLPERWVADELRSLDVPGGLLALVGDDIELVDAAGEPYGSEPGPIGSSLRRLGRAFGGEQLYVGHARFVPTPDAAWGLVVSGSGVDSAPTVALRTLQGDTLWRATPTEDVEALAVLQPERGPPLIGVLCEDGQLLVLTHAGTLVWRTRLQESSLLGLEAGRLADGDYFAVAAGSSVLLYRLEGDVDGP